MKRLIIKSILGIIGIILLGYGFQNGMELDKLLACGLGGTAIGIAIHL